MPGEDVQSWSTTTANNGSADSSIDWSEGMPRASVNNSARAMMAAHAKSRNLQNSSIVTSGTANAQVFTSGVGYTATPIGLRVLLKIGVGLTNTGSTTLNMDGIGDVAIKNALAVDLRGGEMVAGSLAEFVYNGTNWILLFNIPAAASLPPVTTTVPPTDPVPTVPLTDLEGFNTFTIEGRGIAPDVDNCALVMRFSHDNGATWETGISDYLWAYNLTDAAGNFAIGGYSAGYNYVALTNYGLSIGPNNSFDFSMQLFNLSSTTLQKSMKWDGVSTHPVGTSVLVRWLGSGTYVGSFDPVNAVQFFMVSPPAPGTLQNIVGTFTVTGSEPTDL